MNGEAKTYLPVLWKEVQHVSSVKQAYSYSRLGKQITMADLFITTKASYMYALGIAVGMIFALFLIYPVRKAVAV